MPAPKESRLPTPLRLKYFPFHKSHSRHAEDVARKRPTCVVLGCKDAALAQRLQRAFSAPYFRAYTSDDVPGIELGGALKNIYALAAGMCDGLGLGDNAKAALIGLLPEN